MSHPVLHPAIFEFLKAINEHNTRPYFASIKPLYEEVLYSVRGFCQELIEKLSQIDSSLVGLDAKQCLFRIYRDARRISEGDQIYKNNFGFYITPTGKNSKQAGYYVHIQSENSFFGGGIYRPDSKQLLSIRKKIVSQGDEYYSIIHKKKFIQQFGSIQGEKTKNIPRGFLMNDKYSDVLKYKQHLIHHHYDNDSVLHHDFFENILENCKIAKPCFDRLNAIE